MKKFTGFRSEQSTGKVAPLPEGAYVATIKAARVIGEEPDQSLILRLEIAEGEYMGYFMNRYQRELKASNGKYEPKYRGDYRLRIPNDNNKKAMYPESDIRRFNDAIWRIEQSNPGYHWDWDENSLTNLKVGISMQAGEYNGTEYTRPARLEVVDDVRRGIVPKMQRREPRSDAYEPPVDQVTGFTKVEDKELPWF